ncbi:MAG: hypothetical protein M1838_004140 [Thelocarpon superellum]|nr:MAG: hypothetical protein M1838_004140 [Thelocarpon superellum]
MVYPLVGGIRSSTSPSASPRAAFFPTGKMFGSHQRSLYQYPAPDPERSARNPLNRHPIGPTSPVRGVFGDKGPLPEGATVSNFNLPDFGREYSSPDSSRPKTAPSNNFPFPTEADETPAVPDMHQRSIQFPVRTRHATPLSPFTIPYLPSSAVPLCLLERCRDEVLSNHPSRPERASSGRSPASHQMGSRSGSTSSAASDETKATSTLPALQTKGPPDENDQLEPLVEDDPSSFNLVTPANASAKSQAFSLESRSDQLFSRKHLELIFSDPQLLLQFTSFLSRHRPRSVPLLIYYLDSTKALRAIKYANAIAETLVPVKDQDFTAFPPYPTVNSVLEEKASEAFDAMVLDDLPAYVTHMYTRIVSLSITRRITGTLPHHLREASEGLAEVFCLTDPSRADNPIVFASEEFHRTTQYGMSYVIGRNCRFLQGPRTNPRSVQRLREAITSGRECCEVFLNYRRDGSPFMNLLMCAPLTDSRGQLRYFIGAQVDVSGVVKDCTDLESLRQLVEREEQEKKGPTPPEPDTPAFQHLSEILNLHELETVRRWGGKMHRDPQDEETDAQSINWQKPRLMLASDSPESSHSALPTRALSGRLAGVYEHYLLVRPHPSLRILFASPSLRVPGILQSPFMNRIGGSNRVREELTQALAEGRGVTARIRWLARLDEEGRARWVHCTPLQGSNGNIGVWMIVLVDEEKEHVRRWREAPPVNADAVRPQSKQRHYRPGPVDHESFVPQSASKIYSARNDSLNPPPSPTHTNQSVLSVRIE